MKKTLLAAALAVGFAGVAQAETSVTLYGVIDTGIQYQTQTTLTGVDYTANGGKGSKQYTKGKRFGLSEGYMAGAMGSRWGLRGVEDLGNGLRAEFTLESGFYSPTAEFHDDNRLFNRQAWLGLASDSWGSVRFGRQYTTGFDLLGGLAPFGNSYGLANSMSYFGPTFGDRWDNTIKYTTPNFSGFQAALAYSFEKNGKQDGKVSGQRDPNERAFSAAVKYANGPVGVALSYDQSRSGGAGSITRSFWALAGSYDFEVVKVHAGFGQARNGSWYSGDNALVTSTGGNIAMYGDVLGGSDAAVNGYDKGFKANSYMLGLSAPVGGGTVMLEWGMMDPRTKSHAVRNFEKVWRANDAKVEVKKAQRYALGYNYPLSKRTAVYAVAAHEKNSGFVRGNKATDITIGLNHRF